MKKTTKQLCAALLAFIMLVTSLSWDGIIAEANAYVQTTIETEETSTEQNTETAETSAAVVRDENGEPISGMIEETDPVEFLEPEEVTQDDIIEQEQTEDMTVYDLGGGKRMGVFHSNAVRFKNKEGEWTDYDPSLVPVEEKVSENGNSLSGYAYENRQGDKKNYFPEKLQSSTPVRLEQEGYGISFHPVMEEMDNNVFSEIGAFEPVTVEDEFYTDAYEEESLETLNAIYEDALSGTTIQYQSSDIGIKETIYLDKIPEDNAFVFNFYLEGVTVRHNLYDEGLTFYDEETGDIVASMEAPNMNDATENAYSEALTTTVEELDEEGAFRITITADKEYLDDVERIYPVAIDPTVTWTGTDDMVDTYICNGSSYKDINFYDSSITTLAVGYSAQGVYRSYFRFKNLASAISGKSVESAKLTFSELAASYAGETVQVRRVTEAWYINSITWNTRAAFSTTYDTFVSSGVAGTKTVDITKHLRNQANGTIDGHGLMLKAADETSSGKFVKLANSRHATASKRPKLVVVYYDYPATPTVSVTPVYLKQGGTLTASWSGLTSEALSYVQYRVATYDAATATETTKYVPYSDDTKIGTTASGTVTIPASANWPEGTYKFVIRGVDKAGTAGTGKGFIFYIDGTAPVLSGAALTPATSTSSYTSQTANPVLTWSGASDTLYLDSIKYSVNGGTEQTAGTAASGQITLTGSFVSGTNTVRVWAVDKAGNTSAVKTLYYYKDITQPSASISISSAEGVSLPVVTKTINIDAVISDTPSGVKTASLVLLNSAGTQVGQALLSNITASTGTTLNTRNLDNGSYTLKLTVTDNAGNTRTVTTAISVENRLDAPTVLDGYSNDGNFTVSWAFGTTPKNLKELEYQLPDTSTWIKIANSGTQTGTASIAVSGKEGTYAVKFRGVDTYGVAGQETTVNCIVDMTKPVIEKESFRQGVLNGSVTDSYIKSWTVTIKQKGSGTTEEVLASKTENYTNEMLASVDLTDDTKYPADNWYIIKITALDQAGNQSSKSFSVYKGGSGLTEEPSYEIEAPSGMEEEDIWWFSGDDSFVIRKTEKAAEELELASVEWYLNGVKEEDQTTVVYDDDLTNGEKYPENKNNTILAIVKGKDGNDYLTGKTATRTYEEQPENQTDGTNTLLDIYFSEQIYEFTFQPSESKTTGQTITYKVRTGNGEWKTLESGKTYRAADIGDLVTLSELEIQAEITGGAQVSSYTLTYKVVDEQDFVVSLFEQYRPRNVSAQDKLDYKTHINWELTAKGDDNESALPKMINEIASIDGEDAGKIYYELYRGTDKNFVADEAHLVTDSIETNYWTSIEADTSERTYYYKLRAVERKDDGTVLRTSHFSNIAETTGVAADEYAKRLGCQEYWGYTDLSTPNGNGGVELSQGNFYYSQEDVSLPNAQLELGLTRHYNSQSTVKTSFGTGWDHNYNLELIKLKDISTNTENGIVFKDISGTIYRFVQKEGSSTEYYSEANEYVTLKINENSAVGIKSISIGADTTASKEIEYVYTLTTKGGTLYLFDVMGRLVYEEEPNGTFLTFRYDDQRGFLSTVTTEKGRTLEFIYNEESEGDCALVKQIVLPDGTTLNYNYVHEETDDHDRNYRLASVAKKGAGESETTVYAYEYNEDWMMDCILDAESNRYEITYAEEAADDLTKVQSFINPLGETLHIGYETASARTTTTKKTPDGTVLYTVSSVYDGQGYITQETDAQGSVLTREYENGVITKETSPVSIHSYDSSTGNVSLTVENRTEITAYGARNNPQTETDALGNVVTYGYAGSGTTLANQDLPVTESETGYDDLLLRDYEYEYDEAGNEIFSFDDITDEEIISTYDSDGNVLSETGYEYDDGSADKTEVNRTVYEYNADGTVKKETVTTPESSSVTEYTYDSMGRMLTSVTVTGDTTETTASIYDYMGREIRSTVTLQKGSDIKTEVTEKTYDDNGTLLTETAKDGTVTTYTYDALNRVIRRVVTKGELSRTYTTEYSYEKDLVISQGGSLTRTIPVAYKEVQKLGSKTLSTTYKDGAGKTVREISSGITTDHIYDSLGTQVGTVTAGKLILQVCDSAGNVTETIENAQVKEENGAVVYYAGTDSVVTSAEYNSRGDVTEETDGTGITTKFVYDSEGRLTAVNDSDNTGIGTYSYRTTGGVTVTTLTDALGKKSISTVDAEGRETAVRDESKDGNIVIETVYTYDTSGDLTKTTYADGSYLEYSYDAGGLTTEIRRYDASETLTGRTAYTYDPVTDAVLTMIDYGVESGTETAIRYTGYAYDDFGRMISYMEVDGTVSPTTAQKEAGKVSYVYNEEDQLTALTYPQSEDEVKGLKFEYNTDGWLTQVKVTYDSSEEVLREYTYNSDGTVQSMKDHTDSEDSYILKSYVYDALGRVTAIEATKNGDTAQLLESYGYTYDKNSNILSETIVNNTPSSASEKMDETRTHTYDSFGRLTKTVYTDRVNSADSRTVSYTYDKAGNRLMQKVGNETTTYTYNGLHQLTSAVAVEDSEEASNKTYTYDAKGNELSESDSVAGTGLTYEYDVESQMVKATATTGSTIVSTQENWYNGNGQRIGKTEVTGKDTSAPVTETRRYFYDGTSVLYTTDDTGNLITKNLIGLSDNAIATRRYEGSYEDQNYFYLKDIRGSVTSVVDSSMTGVTSYEYDDFGVTTIKGDQNFENQICYTGGIYDELTGLYYLNARYYDPEIGRFLSEDTYRGETDDFNSWHLYLYCANNPINFTDPSGHWLETVLDVASIGWSMYDLANDPSWKTLGNLAWDVSAAFLPFVPGSYSVKGVKKVATGLKVTSKTKKVTKLTVYIADKANDFCKGSKCLTIGKYNSLKTLCKGVKGIQKHHIVEKRFYNVLGISKNKALTKIPCIPISTELHREISARFTKITKKYLVNGTIGIPELRKICDEVYHDMPELKKIARQIIQDRHKLK